VRWRGGRFLYGGRWREEAAATAGRGEVGRRQKLSEECCREGEREWISSGGGGIIGGLGHWMQCD
jgi:hypothetical protein